MKRSRSAVDESQTTEPGASADTADQRMRCDLPLYSNGAGLGTQSCFGDHQVRYGKVDILILDVASTLYQTSSPSANGSKQARITLIATKACLPGDTRCPSLETRNFKNLAARSMCRYREYYAIEMRYCHMRFVHPLSMGSFGSAAAPQNSHIPAALLSVKRKFELNFPATKMCMAASEV